MYTTEPRGARSQAIDKWKQLGPLKLEGNINEKDIPDTKLCEYAYESIKSEVVYIMTRKG